jgi:hypothetical protein
MPSDRDDPFIGAIESREAGGSDPIDRLQPPTPRRRGRLAFLLRTRAALGLRPIAAPAIVFVPLGFALGPRALGLIGEAVLARLDAVVSVALATLGVFVGLALNLRGRADRLLFAAASLEAGVTIVTVALTSLFLVGRWGMPLDLTPLLVAAALGIAASASSAGAAEAYDDPARRVATRVADLDDVVPIALGGLVIAATRGAEPGVLLQGALATALVGLACAVAGWLLFERAESPAERGVFLLGVLALLGGIPAYLSLSPLLAGMIAGAFWTRSPGVADRFVREDLQRIQHPVVLLLLIAAGATLTVTPVALWLVAPYILFRLTGKLAGGWLAARLAPRVAPADLGAYLIPPGVLGIAFALNFAQATDGGAAVAVVTVTAIGSLAAELLALAGLPARTS